MTTKEISPLRGVELPETDRLLRDDVRRLGALVGEILVEQEGDAFLAEVERVRVAAIQRRESHAPVDELAALLSGLELGRAERMVRAFSSYFKAVNVAELVHRVRRRREYQRAGSGPQPGGLAHTLASLRDQGVSRTDVEAVLHRLRVEPVFTAHPTEAVRRALLEKERDVVRGLMEDIDRALTPKERAAALARIRQALTTAWQTDETPPEKPTVADELEHVSFYLSDVLLRVVPVFFEELEAALTAAHDSAATEPPSSILGFGSWVGGDMDGNPSVGADTIAHALEQQRRLVVRAYRRDVDALRRRLSQTSTRVAFSPPLLEALDAYSARMPEVARMLKPRHADMPYRRLLSFVSARLDATANDDSEHAYADASEFERDIRRVDDSLQGHRGTAAGRFGVRRLLRRIEVFGFHLATLDVRQDSAVHEASLAAVFADPQWSERDPSVRAARLGECLASRGPELSERALAVTDPQAARTLAVFRTIADALPRYGPRAIGPYIVSMSRSASDALAVLVLARMAGCTNERMQVPLDVAPLFETVADLDAAEGVLRSLFADPAYRAHLTARADRQIVMLGYSDSAKDSGLFASRWALQRTQVALTALSQESGIRIVFFHGRGGSLSRGGGKTERAVIAAPRGSVDGYLRLTEQGEVIHRKFGVRAIALRNLEQATAAVLRATLRPRPVDPREDAWRCVASDIARASRAHYRGLIYEREGFVDYFREATPIDVIERLRIGSRPSKRGNAGGATSLRAIPWVFAWSQCRSGMTGWYGVGTGLERAIATHGVDALVEMAEHWPFFGTLLDDVEMVLAKADLSIFERYSRLSPAHDLFHPDIAAEFSRTRDALLRLRRADELLSTDPRLRVPIRLRNPYVDPMSLLQVDLLSRWREAGRPEHDALFRALVTTVNGIAAGVQTQAELTESSQRAHRSSGSASRAPSRTARRRTDSGCPGLGSRDGALGRSSASAASRRRATRGGCARTSPRRASPTPASGCDPPASGWRRGE